MWLLCLTALDLLNADCNARCIERGYDAGLSDTKDYCFCINRQRRLQIGEKQIKLPSKIEPPKEQNEPVIPFVWPNEDLGF